MQQLDSPAGNKYRRGVKRIYSFLHNRSNKWHNGEMHVQNASVSRHTATEIPIVWCIIVLFTWSKQKWLF